MLFLPTFLIEPVLLMHAGKAGSLYVAGMAAALVLFLPAYLAGSRLHQRRRGIIVALHVVLGVALTSFNTGASVFFIYAAAVSAHESGTRTSLGLISGAAAAGLVTAFVFAAPLYYWIAAGPIALIVGGVQLNVTRLAHAEREIRVAQQQNEHLVAADERARIARDLHDVLGQTLSMIVLKSQLAERMARIDPERTEREARDIQSAARDTLRQVREAIEGYHPSFGQELDNARELLSTAGLHADVDIEDANADARATETLALVLREAVTNVVRHAGATTCRIGLAARNGCAVLTVWDDGASDVAGLAAGLRGMRARVIALGGHLDTVTGAGTQLTVSVPLSTAGKPSTATVPQRS